MRLINKILNEKFLVHVGCRLYWHVGLHCTRVVTVVSFQSRVVDFFYSSFVLVPHTSETKCWNNFDIRWTHLNKLTLCHIAFWSLSLLKLAETVLAFAHFGHANKYANEPETILKHFQNISELFFGLAVLFQFRFTRAGVWNKTVCRFVTVLL